MSTGELVWLNLAERSAPFYDQVWQQLDFRLGGDRAKFGRYGLAGTPGGHDTEHRSMQEVDSVAHLEAHERTCE